MSVRHIHARPGEYIAVHRSKTYPPSHTNPYGDGSVFIIGAILLLFFWKLILKLAVIGIIIYFTVRFASIIFIIY